MKEPVSKFSSRIALVSLIMAGFLSLVIVSSMFSDWGVAYGQTAGGKGKGCNPGNPGGTAGNSGVICKNKPKKPPTTPDCTPSNAINTSADRVAPGGSVVAQDTIASGCSNGNSNGGGNTGSLSLYLLKPFSLATQGNLTARNVMLKVKFPGSLAITEAVASKGATSVAGQTVNSNIGDLGTDDEQTLTINAVAGANGASEADLLSITSTLSADVVNSDGSVTHVSYTVTDSGSFISDPDATANGGSPANPGSAPLNNGGQSGQAQSKTGNTGTGVVPGLPKTGTNGDATQNQIQLWQTTTLIILSFVVVGSICVLVSNRKKLR